MGRHTTGGRRDDGRATYTVPEFAKLVGIGRNSAYEAAARGEIPGLIRIGRRVLISRWAVDAWLGRAAGS